MEEGTPTAPLDTGAAVKAGLTWIFGGDVTLCVNQINMKTGD